MKILPVGMTSFHADRQTEQKQDTRTAGQTVAFLGFLNVPKDVCCFPLTTERKAAKHNNARFCVRTKETLNSLIAR